VDRRAVGRLGSAFVLALALGGCGASGGSGANPSGAGQSSSVADGQTKVESYYGMVKEYRATVSTLSWPAGITPDPNPLSTDKATDYEVGSGEGDATFRWMCAWSGEYLKNRSSNPNEAKAALDQWASITTLPAWNTSYSDPSMRQMLLDSISKARLGDPSVIQSFHTANC
jgi:hypothetical protein